MRIISKKTLARFWQLHPTAKDPLLAWLNIAEEATWRLPSEVTVAVSHSRAVGDNRVVFRIKGNDFRLVVHINYSYGIVYIKFVGTHAEYNEIDPETVSIWTQPQK